MASLIKCFQDLTTWQNAHELVLLTYKQTLIFPSYERFGLSSQMQRSAVSITSNIAEGFGRATSKEKIRFYVIARGSLHELENQFILALDLAYLDRESFDRMNSLIGVIHRLLNALIQKTKQFKSFNSNTL